MDTLNISTGVKRLSVSVDGVNGRVLEFNPEDVLFMERLHRFYRVVMEKAREWERKQPEHDKKLAEIPVDDRGIPVEVETASAPVKEMNTFMREQLDVVFGEGTSTSIFGDAVYRNPAIYILLFDGIRKHIEPARADKMKKYTRPETPKKPRKRTKKAK